MISAQIGYCPITILPTSLDKLFEKLLGRQFTEYMDPKLGNSLTAYRKNDGCDTTLLGLVEKWKMDLDNKQVVGVLSSDMNKAFDSVSPPLLIKKLESYNFSATALHLVSYAAVFRLVTQRCGEERCVTSLKMAAWETTLHLLRSYFSHRQGRVKLGSVISQWKNIIRGCPQGSTFGPLLWNSFQNDLACLLLDMLNKLTMMKVRCLLIQF